MSEGKNGKRINQTSFGIITVPGGEFSVEISQWQKMAKNRETGEPVEIGNPYQPKLRIDGKGQYNKVALTLEQFNAIYQLCQSDRVMDAFTDAREAFDAPAAEPAPKPAAKGTPVAEDSEVLKLLGSMVKSQADLADALMETQKQLADVRGELDKKANKRTRKAS